MKLESLNNEKFKLANTEMSTLIGGKITITPTGGGEYNPPGTTADKYYYYTGTDVVNGVYSVNYSFTGTDDVARRNAFNPPTQK